MANEAGNAAEAARQARLAAALRANLQRRKARERGMDLPVVDDCPPPAPLGPGGEQ